MANYKSILFEQMIKDFAETEVKPLAQEVDEEERFPKETVDKMAKMGLMGVIVPKQYGGCGGDYNMYISAVEELSKHCGTTGVKAGAAVSLSRNDVDYLVTEYGCVSLRGTSIAERAERIISVAHPAFREQIRKEALAIGIIAEK